MQHMGFRSHYHSQTCKITAYRGHCKYLSWLCFKTQGSRALWQPWFPEKPTRSWYTFWTITPVEQTSYSPLELNEISVKTKPGSPDKQVTTPPKDDSDLPLESITPENVPQLVRKLMSLTWINPRQNNPTSKTGPTLQQHSYSPTVQQTWQIL